MRLTFLSAFLLGFVSICTAQSGANWNYEGHTGPLVWGKLDRAYEACSKGHEQSPLDIGGAHLNKALQPLEFHYIAGPLTVENTGRGIVAHVNAGSSMVANGVRYNLVELDFHHPSEHSVKGKLSDMEVDLVHRSDDGKLAILAVRLNQDRGFPNALLASLFDHLPSAGKTAKITDMVSAGAVLPADRGYWTYVGSEVTPPCTEGVEWYVFENDVSMSRTQLQSFTNLFRMNTRPIQDAHGRRIEASE
ncbi:putative Carbonic anhydrase [Candidatus Sulfotelmatomonas gaucii]|uniref:carbonic anhydrase n=1 Tax=Candidatus Sulfuritelmatomonas gaucii TaxID=2043161 RepID=A0A2N9LHP9_9BACT|nr:putative Carbonic anhydrase [Candidatus Sulfotelmatomonas gaucii]